MADTYTTRLRALKPEQYSRENSWGPDVAAGVLDMIDESWGVEAVTVNGDVTLTSNNGLTDQARNAVLILSGAGGFAVTTPAVDKPYLIINNCSADVTVKPSGGTAATIRAGMGNWYYPNAGATAGNVVDPTLDKIKTAAADVSLGSNKLTNVATPTSSGDAATKGYVDTFTANRSAGGFKLTNLANGSTGTQDAAPVAQVESLIASATVNMPSQTGNANKFLQTDGTNPSWQKVDLADTNDVTGVLGTANGGTGGTLPVANGGTGATTAQNGRLALLPAVASNGLKVLRVNSGATDYELASPGDVLAQMFAAQTTATISNDASVSFTLASSKKEHIFQFVNVIPAEDLRSLRVLSSIDSGSNYNVSNSAFHMEGSTTAAVQGTAVAASTTGIQITGNFGSDASEFGASGVARLSQHTSSHAIMVFDIAYINSSGAITRSSSSVRMETTSAITNVRFQFNSGNMESGLIYYYTRE